MPIEAVWIAGALFFGMAQLVFLVVLSTSPANNVDEDITFLDWVLGPVQNLFDCSGYALTFTLVMTWVYALVVDVNALNVIFAIGTTVFGVIAFLGMRRILRDIVVNRLRQGVKS